MTDKELRKLSRKDLLEILLKQSTEMDKLKQQLENAEKALSERQIKIDNAGSLAEAALQLNGVFEAAEKASKQYIDNIIALNERKKIICNTMEEKSRAYAKRLFNEIKRQKKITEEETKQYCNKMIQDAEFCWDEIFDTLKPFMEENKRLKETLETIRISKERIYEEKRKEFRNS